MSIQLPRYRLLLSEPPLNNSHCATCALRCGRHFLGIPAMFHYFVRAVFVDLSGCFEDSVCANYVYVLALLYLFLHFCLQKLTLDWLL